MTLTEAASFYHSLGLSVIPVNQTKVPIGAWTANQQKLIQPGNFETAYGLGMCCGKVSGSLEAIDIDCKYDLTGTLITTFRALVDDQAPCLLKKMVIQKTQNNGYHLVYRCSEIEGNKKLASRHTTDSEKESEAHQKVKVLIETRGEGGYIMAYPSPGYQIVYGSFEGLNEITPAERDILFTCARSLNEVYEKPVDRQAEKSYPHKYSGHVSPFDDWNERGDILKLLEDHGWKLVRQKGTHNFLLRPGGTGVLSADWDSAKRLFYVWTTSSQFDNDKAYNPVHVLAKLMFQDDFSACSKWLLEQGYGEKYEKQHVVPPTASAINLEDDNYDFLVPVSETDAYLESLRNGTFEVGKTTGIPSLDQYFVLKRASLNIINGMDNVGKSTVLWYLMLLASLNHGWKWIVLSNENSAGYVVRKLIEFYLCKKIDHITVGEFQEANKYIHDHFTLIRSEELYNFKDVINMGTKLLTRQKYDGILIDPYNSLMISLTETSKLSTHDYHYQAASEIRNFCKKNDIAVFLNCHVVTPALRVRTSDGFPAAPQKADTEGGGKFSNKADNFITIHRYTQHPTEWMYAQIHVRKIKEQETGGAMTPQDRPYLLRMISGNCGFEDIDGYNPVLKRNDRRQKLASSPQDEDDAPF